MAGRQDTLEFDVMQSNIPLLITKEEMAKHAVVISIIDNEVTWEGQKAETIKNSSGNISISLISNKAQHPVNNTQVETQAADEKEKHQRPRNPKVTALFTKSTPRRARGAQAPFICRPSASGISPMWEIPLALPGDAQK